MTLYVTREEGRAMRAIRRFQPICALAAAALCAATGPAGAQPRDEARASGARTRAVRTLVEALKDRDPKVRSLGISGLGWMLRPQPENRRPARASTALP